MPDQSLLSFYHSLLHKYGPQGWWPVTTDGGPGYHPGDYSFPQTPQQRFEICVGTILTQNTQWQNAEKALSNLKKTDTLSPGQIKKTPPEKLADLIRHSGYFNQKQRKLRILAEFFQENDHRCPDRSQWLSLWGIGPETADSLLLYGYRQLEMVIDAYTLRILTHYTFLPPGTTCQMAKQFCVRELPREVSVYQEFHALMVAHGKKDRYLIEK